MVSCQERCQDTWRRMVSYQDICWRPCKLAGYMEGAWLAVRNSARTYGGGLVSHQDTVRRLGKLPDTWRRLGQLSGTVPGHVEEAWLATRIYDGGLVSWQDTRRGLG